MVRSLQRIAIPLAILLPLLQRPSLADEPTYQNRTLSSWLQDIEFPQMMGSMFMTPTPTPASIAKEKNVTAAIRAIGKDALPLLIDRLNSSPDPTDRHFTDRTYWAFTVLGPDAEPAIPTLIQLLKPAYPAASESDPREKNRIIMNITSALQIIGNKSLPALIDALSDKDKEIRFGAATALACYYENGSDSVPPLIKSLRDRDSNVRWRSALTLGSLALEPDLVIPALIKRLKLEPEDNVRTYVMISLEKFGPNAIPALEIAAADPNPILQTYAKESLEKICAATQEQSSKRQ